MNSSQKCIYTDYEYLSSNRVMRKLLSQQEQSKKLNEMLQEEFSGANIGEETSAKIHEMLSNDQKAIKENSEKFKKILPQYIIAKQQVNIHTTALNELMAKVLLHPKSVINHNNIHKINDNKEKRTKSSIS